MPEAKTRARAAKDRREGKAPTTQAGEFVREEIHHVREGKHGARSTKQAIAIGLSKARRSGVELAPPRRGQTSEATRRKAAQDARRGQQKRRRKPARSRSQATSRALEREPRKAASSKALSRQARSSARARGKGTTTSRRGAGTRAGKKTKGRSR